MARTENFENPEESMERMVGTYNWCKEGKGFYKMDENSICIIREELIEDFYSLDQIRLKEIKKLHENFEDDQIQFAIKLETYEKEHVQSQEE